MCVQSVDNNRSFFSAQKCFLVFVVGRRRAANRRRKERQKEKDRERDRDAEKRVMLFFLLQYS